MKRKQLIKHIKKYDGFLLREGRRHSIYQRGRLKTEVPRHNEVVDELARKICKDLDMGSIKNNLVEFALEFAVDLIDLIEQNRRNSELFRGLL
jgi:mRNA interferase HicA